MATIDFSRVTVRDFLVMLEPGEEPALQMFLFSNKVVVGGIMHVKLDALASVIGQVAEKIQRFSGELKDAIEMGQTLGEIDEYLNLGDKTMAKTISEPGAAIQQLPPETLSFFFTERDARIIENCKSYAEDDPGGLTGHNLMMIISNFDDLVGRLMKGRTFKDLVDLGRE